MKNKNGRSLIYMILGILIVLICVAIVIIMLIANNTKLASEAFSKELMEIEKNIRKIQTAGGKLPIDDLVEYNKDTLLTLLSKREQTILATEIKENGDDNAKFSVIDMSKLGAITTIRGSKEIGGEDIFVIAKPSLKIYYVGGVQIDGQYYYSVTKRLAKVTKFKDDDTFISANGNIKNESDNVKGETKSWTNALSIKIPLVIGDNKIILKIGNKEVDITKQILDKKFILKETEEITREDIEKANSVIIKKVDNAGVILSEEIVDISNIDTIPPVLEVGEEFIKVSSETTFNKVEILPKDDKSGVDYVVCEYLKKKNSKGQIVNVKESTIIDKQAIKANLLNTGERSKEGIFKIPLYISEFRILAVDKAGNASEYLEVKIPDAYVSNEAF